MKEFKYSHKTSKLSISLWARAEPDAGTKRAFFPPRFLSSKRLPLPRFISSSFWIRASLANHKLSIRDQLQCKRSHWNSLGGYHIDRITHFHIAQTAAITWNSRFTWRCSLSEHAFKNNSQEGTSRQKILAAHGRKTVVRFGTKHKHRTAVAAVKQELLAVSFTGVLWMLSSVYKLEFLGAERLPVKLSCEHPITSPALVHMPL